MAHALSIAGSDPSGGAGIQADLKTFHAFGAYGMAVLTSLTAQNTQGVTGIHDVPPEFVRLQIETVLADVRVDAAKTGMLKTPAIIEAVADAVDPALAGRIVVDPVMVATSGDRLIEDDAVDRMVARLFPLAAVVTPNREEAEVLLDGPIGDLEGARTAARVILDAGAKAVVVKGVTDGVDLFVSEEAEEVLTRPMLDVGPTHGSGCTFSSAIAAGLARGDSLLEAVRTAKDFVWRAIRDAVAVGGGGVPLNHQVPREERAE
jgi:hydroxymethylpyrimidine/phosphomethylpyrimidine kinase